MPSMMTSKRTQFLRIFLVLLLPFFFTVFAIIQCILGNYPGWSAVAVFILMWFVTLIGVTVGLHRLLAHRAFEGKGWVKRAIIISANMAGQGPPLYWVSIHRQHHHLSDQDGDPHSPHSPFRDFLGFMHAHIGWMFNHKMPDPIKYAPDLISNSQVQWAGRYYLSTFMAGLLIPAALCGLLEGTWHAAFEGMLWGGWVRVCFTQNVTWSINSLTHTFGSRPFRTGDQSTNNGWLAVFSLGESWHNNHHAFPWSARFGLSLRQVDLGGCFIEILEALGLAWDVKRPSPEAIARKMAKEERKSSVKSEAREEVPSTAGSLNAKVEIGP